MDYEEIKQLARSSGQRVTDLIVLAPQNDPFYSGTPNDWALAQWFAGLWNAFGYTNRVHIRRVHYQIISQNPPVALPNGKPYENTEESWGILNLASKAARYLGLVTSRSPPHSLWRIVYRKPTNRRVFSTSRTSTRLGNPCRWPSRARWSTL